MQVSERTISALAKVITGDAAKDGPVAPYLSGPQLVAFFRAFGFHDEYGNSFPSRWKFTEDRLRLLNSTDKLARVIETALDPERFLDTEFSAETAGAYLAKFLRHSGYDIVLIGNRYRVRSLSGATVSFQNPLARPGRLTHEFIEEQVRKCDQRLADGDFTGTITNARSLVEAVLLSLEEEITGKAEKYDGDMPKLYKRVQKLLNLDPSRQDISEPLKQLLTGLSGIVAGLAPMRNRMSDAHPLGYRPAKHHARLAANAAKTLADFLVETYLYQRSKRLLAASGAGPTNAKASR
jgi:hypothetical protein